MGASGPGIKPETPEGIDRAVQAAKKAQVEWAKTSFAERRRVLKTLLKYVVLVLERVNGRIGILTVARFLQIRT